MLRFVFAVLLCSTTALCALEAPKYAVGDWVEFTLSSTQPNASPSTVLVRETITEVTASEASLQTRIRNSEQDEGTFVATRIPLNQPVGILASLLAEKAKPEAEGEEEILVGAQKLLCKWSRYIRKSGDSSETTTLHFHSSIPIHGLARIETQSTQGLRTVQTTKAFGTINSKPREKP